MVEFGEQLRRAREEKGMTQQTLAEQLFVTRQSVSRWECGDRFPDLLTTKKISEILDVSLDEMLSGEDMNKIVERNPVIENKAANNVVIALYALTAFSLLMQVMSFISQDIIAIATRHPGVIVDDHEVILTAVPQISYVLQMFVIMFGLIQAIKGTLSPKRIGATIIAFLAAETLAETVIYVSQYVRFAENLKLTLFILKIIPGIIIAVSAFFFFIRKSKKIIWFILISIVSIVIMLGSIFAYASLISMSIDMNTQAEQQQGFISAIGPRYFFPRVALYGLFLYQALILWKKRKAAADAAS